MLETRAEFPGAYLWSLSERLGGIRLPDKFDLYRTKANTGPEHDWQDQIYLESRINLRFHQRLSVCDLAEVVSMLDRFLDLVVLP